MPRTYRDPEGRDWQVTLDAPGKVMSVPASLEKSGALLPEHAIRIVFTSGDEQMSQEYTELAEPEDLSDEDLYEWWKAAKEERGL